MPHPKVKISDDSGNTVGVTTNALDVNIAGGATIDIGDVDLFLDGGTAVLGNSGTIAAGVLRVTLATDDTLGGVIYADDADWTDGSSKHLLVGGLYQSSPQTVTDGDVAPFSISSNGELHVDMANDSSWLTFSVATANHQSALISDTDSIVTNTSNANTLLGTIDADTGTIASFSASAVASLQIMDDWDESDRAKVNLVAGQAGITANAGAVAANTPRVTLASDDPAVVDLAAIEVLLTGIDSDTNSAQGYLSNLSGCQYVDDANWTDGSSKHFLVGGLYQTSMQSVTDGDVGPFQIDANGVLKVSPSTGSEFQVDVVAALPAGTNAIGKLAANSGVDIGDVDVTSISAGTNAIGKVGHDITGIVSDRDVDVGTTAEKIHTAADVAIKRIDIQAAPENTSYIYVGDNGVAGDGSGGGIRLAAGDFYSIDISNTSEVYVAATVADEDVYYTYHT